MEFRVRYSETDQMSTFYNSRALEWFEMGRTELLRAAGRPYTQMESQGVLLPVTEAYVKYEGRAVYDDLLRMTLVGSMPSRARIRVDVTIEQASDGAPVCRGHTVHAVVNPRGRPIRPPKWLVEALGGEADQGHEGPSARSGARQPLRS